MSKQHFDPITGPVLRDLRVLHHNLTEALIHIRNYHVQSERRLAHRHLELVEGRPLSPRPDDTDAIWQHFEYENLLYSDAMASEKASVHLLRTGILFSTVAFLESWLMDVCSFCAGFKSRRLTPRDLRQEGLRKMILYLGGVCGVDVSPSDPGFGEIFAFGQIKNIFSHTRGKVANPRQLPAEVIKIVSNPAWCGWDGPVIVLQPEFNGRLLSIAEKFGEEITDALILWIQETARRSRTEPPNSSKEGSSS